MKLILFFLFSFFSIKGCLLSQTTFNKTIDFANGDEVGWSLVEQDDGYILIGGGWGIEIGDYFDQKLKFAKTDLEGNILWTNFIGEPSIHLFCGPQSGIVTQDENIVFCGSKLSAITYSAILVKFNPNTGDTIFLKEFDFDDDLKGLQVMELSDGNLIILATDDNDIYGSILIKTTADGEFIWQKPYGNSNEIASTSFDIKNDTIYLVSRNLFCTPEGYKIRSIDIDGEIIQELLFDEDCPSMGFLSNQGGYYGVGANFPVPPYQSFVYRTDIDGNIQWHYNTSFDLDTLEYEDLFPELIRELPNGDLIVGGYFASNYLGTYFGLISKINTNGEPYWERIYISSIDVYDDSRLLDMEIGSAGEIVLLGSGFSEIGIENQNFWLLKLDSLGCLVPGCDSMDVQTFDITIDNDQISVYPTPSNGYVTISTQLTQSGLFLIELINISNQTVFRKEDVYIAEGKFETTIHLEDLPSGMYLITLTSAEFKTSLKMMKK
ncbi:MAG: T9SS type A sorting domain-containing protein [Bacteroidetes bacterium]|nr:T9SS type A sorting domain-containing protein [Bacteroidota bacterium]